MIEARPYYSAGSLSAAFYDLITGVDASLAGDIDLYAGLAAPGATVLELGAGSGRIAQGLAERGLSVTGVDIAPAMLAKARTRLAALPPQVAARIELRQDDLTCARLGRTFDLVICPFFTLAHIPLAAWTSAFATAVAHLAGGALAAFHLPRLELMRGAPRLDPVRPVMDLPLSGDRRLRLYVKARDFRPAEGALSQVVEYVVSDRTGRIIERSPERLTYFMADPQPPAAAAGLALDRPPIPLSRVGDVWVFRPS